MLPSHQNELLETMGVGETGTDSAFLNPPYCERLLYGGLCNLAKEGSEDIADLAVYHEVFYL